MGPSTGVTRDTVIDGRYRVLDRLGSGGMADVYVAEDAQLGRKVAIKVLNRRWAEDRQFVERFRREASSAAGLQHPSIVGVYDRGEWDGTYYIAMEYLEGRSLKEVVREEGPVAPGRAIDVAVQVLKGLRFAHRRGIVHRDIKPHNVILDAEGRAKVTDFGIARAGASDITETGSIMGTAQYLSPEQAQGHPVDARADLYAVGVLLYELLTGRVPFDADSAVSIALKHVSEPPVPPRERNPRVGAALDAVVLRALAKAPEQRFPDADAFIAALEAAREPTAAMAPVGRLAAPVPFGPDPVDELEDRDRRAWRWLVPLLVALAVAAVGVGAYFLLRTETLRVNDVVGERSQTAVDRLQGRGFEVETRTVDSDNVAEGRVVRQDPAARRRVEEGSTVRLSVSGGPGEATIPTVAGVTRAAAERRLRAAGFRVGEVDEVFSDAVDAGRVVRTEPPEGAQRRRRLRVGLVVSQGVQRVGVPEVRGQGRDAARSALEAAGFTVTVSEREDDDADPGLVLDQQPAPGTRVAPGSSVSLVVARRPATSPVPDVVGDSVNDAVEALTEAGFRPRQRFAPVETPEEDGLVDAQNPGAGEERRRGARIFITVGRFEAPEDLDPDPAAEPTPEPTP